MRLRLCITVALLPLLSVEAAPAHAAAGPAEVQIFRPGMDSKGLVSLDASQLLGHLDFSFGLVLSYAHRPLSLSGKDISPPGHSGVTSHYQISHMVTGYLQAALGLWGHVELGLGLPLSTWTGDLEPSSGISGNEDQSIDAQGAGDLGLRLKGRILDTSRYPLGLALYASLSLPTGHSEALLGAGRWGLEPGIILDTELWRGRVKLVANVGANLVEVRRLHYGVGGALELVPGRLQVSAEVVGRVDLDGPLSAGSESRAHEVLAGLRLYLGRDAYLQLGVGRGLHSGEDNYPHGSPEVRILAGFVLEPAIWDRDHDGLRDDVDRCPDRPEDLDDFEDGDGCPDQDNDRDGLLDIVDTCPDEPEDLDDSEDGDGCPELDELDRDGDGLGDRADRCPDDPEDVDHWEDGDGCPDPDNDRDRILDIDDQCPDAPEDRDLWADQDGCPDPDNDQDGLVDRIDGCPNEPETVNQYKDGDGCPDRAPAGRLGSRLTPQGQVHFATDQAEILPQSLPVLDAVARAMEADLSITLLEIQGHADRRGSARHNMELTRRRAEAVRLYLVQKGIAPARLRARGFGKGRSLKPTRRPRDWSSDRRVEFVILKREE